MGRHLDYIQVATAQLPIQNQGSADPRKNVNEVIKISEEAYEKGVELLLFPELSLTGAALYSHYLQSELDLATKEALHLLLEKSLAWPGMYIVIGMALYSQYHLLNLQVLLGGGKLYAACYNTNTSRMLDPYQLFYRGKEVTSLFNKGLEDLLSLDLGANIKLEADTSSVLLPILDIRGDIRKKVHISLAFDLPEKNTQDTQSSLLCISHNLPAYASLWEEDDVYTLWKNALLAYSKRMACACIHVSSGAEQASVEDLSLGLGLHVEDGLILQEKLLAEEAYVQEKSPLLTSFVDLAYLEGRKKHLLMNQDFSSRNITGEKKNFLEEISLHEPIGCMEIEAGACTSIDIGELPKHTPLRHPRLVAKPFSQREAYTETAWKARCERILSTQASGLYQKYLESQSESLVLGVSGGLDSTLALLVSLRVKERAKRLGRTCHFYGYTLPGFGTSTTTKGNVEALQNALKLKFESISIVEAVRQHFQDIHEDESKHSIVFENAQARERTQVLMDLANQKRGIVVGTGDMSEVALGWCTYNGDHMNMYSCNGGIPKTMIPDLLYYEAERLANLYPDLLQAVSGVCSTPISPELLPADKDGKIRQKTEDSIGDYLLHDFFIYHYFTSYPTVKRMLFLAEQCFVRTGIYTQEKVDETLRTFYRRFHQQQFKRTVSPEACNTLGFSSSSRGGYVQPCHVSPDPFLRALDQCIEDRKKREQYKRD